MKKAPFPTGVDTSLSVEATVKTLKHVKILGEINATAMVLELTRVRMHKTMREGPGSLSMGFHNLLNAIEYTAMELDNLRKQIEDDTSR